MKRMTGILALVVWMFGLSVALAGESSSGRYELVRAGDEYSNFVWRLDKETGWISAFRIGHSEEFGWRVVRVTFLCQDIVEDAIARVLLISPDTPQEDIDQLRATCDTDPSKQ